MIRPHVALALIVAVSGPTALMAQETTAQTTPDCETEFRMLDVDGNGFLSLAEAPRDQARAALDGINPGTDGLSQAEFVQICSSDTWAKATPEEGAPFEGANSFTEEQARERATAWNVADVSALTLDDKGIWRGTGRLGETAVSVAVDYKGNVVTTPSAN